MAYKTQITRECMEYSCFLPAKWEVFNRQNSTYGIFCRTHADRKVEDLKIDERAVDARRARDHLHRTKEES